MDTDVLKERIINGALSDVFKRAPLAAAPRRSVADAANDADAVEPLDTPN